MESWPARRIGAQVQVPAPGSRGAAGSGFLVLAWVRGLKVQGHGRAWAMALLWRFTILRLLGRAATSQGGSISSGAMGRRLLRVTAHARYGSILPDFAAGGRSVSERYCARAGPICGAATGKTRGHWRKRMAIGRELGGVAAPERVLPLPADGETVTDPKIALAVEQSEQPLRQGPGVTRDRYGAGQRVGWPSPLGDVAAVNRARRGRPASRG